MRAKELLILGSTLLKSVPGKLNDKMGGGCALGMMAAAKGNIYMEIENYPGFSWMVIERAKLPCGCDPSARFSIYSAIAHLFDIHVHGDRTWSIERLADWIDIYDQIPQVKMLPVAPAVVENAVEKEEVCCQ